MNYTTNYHLPQWVESDRILMEDFNQAMADIDEGLSQTYTTERRPVELKTMVLTPSHTVGDALLTLDYAPVVVILSNLYSIVVIGNGKTDRLYSSSLNTSAYAMYFELEGNQIKLYSRGEDITSNQTISVVVFR